MYAQWSVFQYVMFRVGFNQCCKLYSRSFYVKTSRWWEMVRLLDRWRWEWRETRCQSDREWRSVKETVEAFSANMPLVREHLLWESGFWPGGKYGERDGGVWTVDKCSRLQVQLVAGLSSVIHWIGPVVHALLNTSWDVLTTSSYRTVTKAVLKKKKLFLRIVYQS